MLELFWGGMSEAEEDKETRNIRMRNPKKILRDVRNKICCKLLAGYSVTYNANQRS